MNTQELIVQAKKVQKTSLKLADELKTKKEQKRQKEENENNVGLQKVKDLLTELEQFNNLYIKPVSFYTDGYYGGNTGLCMPRYYTDKLKINQLEGKNNHLRDSNNELILSYGTISLVRDYEFVITVCSNYFQIQRTIFTFKEKGSMLDIPEKHGYKNRPESIKATFKTIEQVIDYVRNFVIETLDINAEKEKKNQTKKYKILSEYLGKELTDIDKKEHLILEKNEVVPYFTDLIKKDLVKYFDVTLLAKYSTLSIEEIQNLRFALKKNESLHKVLCALVNLEEYSKEIANTYAFSKYVKDYKNHYIVNKGE